MTRAAFTTLAIAAFSAVASAQEVSIDLGAATVALTADAQVDLPITIDASAAPPVEVTIEVGYPADTLRFIEAKPGSSTQVVNARIDVSTTDAQTGGGEAVIALRVAADQPLVTGSLATLAFGITQKAEAGTDARIRNISRTARTKDGQQLKTLGAEGVITFLEPPIACFFYMH